MRAMLIPLFGPVFWLHELNGRYVYTLICCLWRWKIVFVKALSVQRSVRLKAIFKLFQCYTFVEIINNFRMSNYIHTSLYHVLFKYNKIDPSQWNTGSFKPPGNKLSLLLTPRILKYTKMGEIKNSRSFTLNFFRKIYYLRGVYQSVSLLFQILCYIKRYYSDGFWIILFLTTWDVFIFVNYPVYKLCSLPDCR